jgi:hypothetical protein
MRCFSIKIDWPAPAVQAWHLGQDRYNWEHEREAFWLPAVERVLAAGAGRRASAGFVYARPQAAAMAKMYPIAENASEISKGDARS